MEKPDWKLDIFRKSEFSQLGKIVTFVLHSLNLYIPNWFLFQQRYFAKSKFIEQLDWKLNTFRETDFSRLSERR